MYTVTHTKGQTTIKFDRCFCAASREYGQDIHLLKAARFSDDNDNLLVIDLEDVPYIQYDCLHWIIRLSFACPKFKILGASKDIINMADLIGQKELFG